MTSFLCTLSKFTLYSIYSGVFLVYLSQVCIKLVVLAGRNLSLKREIGFAICMVCNAKETLKQIKEL